MSGREWFRDHSKPSSLPERNRAAKLLYCHKVPRPRKESSSRTRSKFGEDCQNDPMTGQFVQGRKTLCGDSTIRNAGPSTFQPRHPDAFPLAGWPWQAWFSQCHKQRAWSMPSCDYLQTAPSKCTVATPTSPLKSSLSAAFKPQPASETKFATVTFESVLPPGGLAPQPIFLRRLKEWTLDRSVEAWRRICPLLKKSAFSSNCKDTNVPHRCNYFGPKLPLTNLNSVQWFSDLRRNI